MTKVFLFLSLFTTTILMGCKEPQDYATLSGKIQNAETLTITIMSNEYNRDIKLEDDGSFKDTLSVKSGVYTLTDGQNKTAIFLANGYDLTLNLDVTDFRNIEFSGIGKESNDYIAERIKFSRNDLANPTTFFELEPDAFKKRMLELKSFLTKASTINVDSSLISQIATENERMIEYLETNYKSKYAAASSMKKGSPSPKFSDFENYEGGTTSLDDLKGKYVYIDVWATWCGPCKQQIPFLKEIESEYEHKNIAFVSISTDRANKCDAWKKMIEDYDMGGYQLFAGTDQSFSAAYQINAIPRFILIDPDGKIVDSNAPRPSDPKLKELFDSLSI